MKISQKLRVVLKSILSLQMGEIATDKAVLVWDGEEDLAEGMEVFIKDENDEIVPAPDGDYTTEDKKVIKVVEGKVAEIADPEAEVADEPVEERVEMEEEAEAEPADEVSEEKVSVEDRVALLEEQLNSISDGLAQILSGIADLENRLVAVEDKLAKVEDEPAADPINEEPAEVENKVKSKLSYLRKN